MRVQVNVLSGGQLPWKGIGRVAEGLIRLEIRLIHYFMVTVIKQGLKTLYMTKRFEKSTKIRQGVYHTETTRFSSGLTFPVVNGAIHICDPSIQ